MGPFATFHRHPAPRRQERCRDVSWMNWSQWPWPPRRVARSASSRTCGWSSNVASWPLGLGDLSLGRFGRSCRWGLGKDVGKTSRIRVEASFFFFNLLFLQLYFLCWLRVWRYVMMNKQAPASSYTPTASIFENSAMRWYWWWMMSKILRPG